MVRQMINSALFSNRNTLSANLMSKLVVRGGGAKVDEALKRFGWDGSSPVISTILTTNIATGVIRGAWFETMGKLEDIKFQAGDLWLGAESGISARISFPNLGILNWNTVDEIRNQTTWIDGSSVTITFKRQDGATLDCDEDITAAGIGGFAVRFTAIPIAVDKVALNAGIIPFDKASLDKKVAEAGSTLSSPNCPTVAMKLLAIGGRSWNARPVDLLPRETESDRVGMGHLPLIESIGSGSYTLPDRDLMEQEVTQLLRAINPTNNVSIARLADLYDNPATFSSSLTGSVSHQWPEYRGLVEAREELNAASG